MAKKEIFYKSNTYTLSYEKVHTDNPNVILFLHGWGSHKALMKHAFGEAFKNYQHLYLDLPGFGQSPLEQAIGTDDYAKIVSLFLESLALTPSIIVGHSFGGKVGTLLKPQKLILLSSAGIVAPKKWKVKSKIAFYKLCKPFFPKTLYRLFATKDVQGMNQTMYEVLKKVVNEDFTEHFRSLPSQTILFWGKDDTTTPLQSAKKIEALVSQSRLFVLEGDHFFFIGKATQIEGLCKESGW